MGHKTRPQSAAVLHKGNARSSPAFFFAQVALAENRLLTVAGVTVIKAWPTPVR